GANEAPPAVVSMFMGDELTGVLEAIENDKPYPGTEKQKIKLGVDSLPRFIRDNTDRNRTSPFAFTGNKFEFRMLGSSNSIACANIMLNTAVAESLKIYADILEGASDFKTALHELIRTVITDHKRIIFNGNGYDDSWIEEATDKRGLLNLRTTPDAMEELLKKKNMEMLISHGVYSERELRSRYEIMLENYCKTVCIEAQTMSDMARKQILPAIERYLADVADAAARKKALDAGISCAYEKRLAKKLATMVDSIDERTDALDGAIAKLRTLSNVTEEANYIRDEILLKMSELREVADEAEIISAESYWPFPSYGDLLFGVN
ncbi:MAG: glutamine synthetase type III, partial [Oscillospiraceae bacterium]|nr:glutamine synthetase type III [Oscillospiraceae bacterium]